MREGPFLFAGLKWYNKQALFKRFVMKKEITKRTDDYAQWYLDVIDVAELAEHSDVRGFMVIKPYGYAIWENIQKVLDAKIKETGHQNAYFPLLVPKSFMSREAQHVEGFAKEMAVVTHHRLIKDPNGEGVIVDPAAKLEEELVIRPTSETIIYATFSNWVQSWRDLPLLINQWANVVRWELRTRLFLRTSEFLWQEGHTVHATFDDAQAEVIKMLGVYQDLAESYLAIPVIPGEKSAGERFAGADITTTIEAMMQDGKALQAGTSHNLGQNFAKAFNIQFADKDGELKYTWQTSWGVSTRLIGALIMAHSDDKGLVLPPNIAPIQVIVVPIGRPEEWETVMSEAKSLVDELTIAGATTKLDDRDYITPGQKFNEWEKKGVPVRIEIGPKDIASGNVVIARRDSEGKQTMVRAEAVASIKNLLEEIQVNLYQKALAFRAANSHETDDYEEFKNIMTEKSGFIYSHWCGSDECETQVNEETKATIRCLPFNLVESTGKCLKCGKESNRVAVFAKAY